MRLRRCLRRSFPTSADLFADLLNERDTDWPVLFISKWLHRQLAAAVEKSKAGHGSGPGGRGFALETDFYTTVTSHEDCIRILDKSKAAIDASSKRYDEHLVRQVAAMC